MKDTTDPLADLGNEALFQIAADLQVQLEHGTAMRPVLYLLIEQRKKAADSIRKLIEIDPCETTSIAALQNEVRLYGDLIQSCRLLLVRGKEADREIAEQDRAEMSEIIGRMPHDEQRLYRLQTNGDD